MIVCSCHGLSHRVVDAHIERGCHTVRELGRACGAGTDCGSCVSDLKERIARVRARSATAATADRAEGAVEQVQLAAK